MNEGLIDEDRVVALVQTYADEECVGEFGEITDLVQEPDSDVWSVQFTTHTYSDTYHHDVRINRVGNVFAHDRDSRFE